MNVKERFRTLVYCEYKQYGYCATMNLIDKYYKMGYIDKIRKNELVKMVSKWYEIERKYNNDND